MRRWALLSAALLALAVPAVTRADDDEDTQDVVFFGESRPVVLRLHIRVNGKSHTKAWEDYVAALFGFLDRDGDGALSDTEAQRAPNAQVLNQMAQSGGFFFAQSWNAAWYGRSP